jgi:hypothetical protein
MDYKLFKITALMETHDENDPMIFTFDLPATDEKGVGMLLSKMDSIRKVISVEETTKPDSEIYKG